MTLTQLLAEISARLPHSFTDTQITSWATEVLRRYYRSAPREVNLLVTLTSGIYTYSTLSTDGVKFENVNYVAYFNTTAAAIASTDVEDYIIYKKSGLLETKGDTYLFDSSGFLGIAPVPTTTGYKIVVNYNKYPEALSTATMTQVPDMDIDYQNLLVYGACQIIAMSGINPDVDMANNYQALLDEELSKARLRNAKKKYKTQNKNKISYKEGWDDNYSWFASSS